MRFGWRSTLTAIWTTVAVVGLSGCESFPWETFQWPNQARSRPDKAVATPSTAERPETVAVAPTPVKPPGLPDRPAPAKPKVRLPPPPAKPNVASPEGEEVVALNAPALPEVRPLPPARLVGLSEAGAESILGKATAISEQPPAVVWQYANNDCQLSLFFYMDVNKRLFRVLTYEVTPKYTDAARCVGTLHESHARNIH